MSDFDCDVLETICYLSIIPKPAKRPLTPEDMEIKQDHAYMPITIVVDGYLYASVLADAGIPKDYFDFEMRKHHFNHLDEILFCYLDEKKNLVFYGKQSEGEKK